MDIKTRQTEHFLVLESKGLISISSFIDKTTVIFEKEQLPELTDLLLATAVDIKEDKNV